MKNDETFTEIYQRYAALVFRDVVSRTKNAELGMEICQQTFLLYYKHIETIERGMEKFWLMKTAKNLLIDYWRKASTRRETLTGDGGKISYSAASENLEQECIDRIFVSEIMEDLQRENILWYEVVDALFIRQMNREEAAKHLGINSGMLRARLYRAKQYLKKKYGSENKNNQ